MPIEFEDTTIAVTSKGRANFDRGTIAALRKSKIEFMIWCPAKDFAAYHAAWPKCQITGHAKPGLSDVHQQIVDHCATSKLILMDDDLRFAYRVAPNKTALYALEDISNPIKWIIDRLDDHAHAGISARQGNNRLPSGYKEAGPMRSVMGLRVDMMRDLGVRMDRLVSKNDYDTTLQLLRLGLPAAITPNWTHDQAGGPYLPGGNTGTRDSAVHAKAAQALHDLHPEFVKVVTKKPKNWQKGDLGERLDVVCYWKKALESGYNLFGKNQGK